MLKNKNGILVFLKVWPLKKKFSHGLLRTKIHIFVSCYMSFFNNQFLNQTKHVKVVRFNPLIFKKLNTLYMTL